jgi:hydrogenase expression/formation protein HypC
MCIAIPGEIIELTLNQAKVTIMGVETIVNIQLIENPKIGDFVLIHAGCAIEIVDKNYSDNYFEMIKPLCDLMEADEDKHG